MDQTGIQIPTAADNFLFLCGPDRFWARTSPLVQEHFQRSVKGTVPEADRRFHVVVS